MKIAISTLFFYKPEFSRDLVKSVLPTLLAHCQKSGDSIDFVITDNTPRTESALDEIRKLIESLVTEVTNLRFYYRQNDFNKGFGQSHNEAFNQQDSDAFIILNNDLVILDRDWIQKLLSPLSDPNVAIVGVESSPRVLKNDGDGIYGTNENLETSDYAEASIAAFRSQLIRQHGLFAKDLKTAYFEDSDVSLRYRELGYRIKYVQIPHEHKRGTSSQLLGEDLLESIREKNKTRFLARWNRYLHKRSFDNKVFVDLVAGGWGDVVAAIPTITGFLRDHPTCTLEIQTNQKQLSRLLSFPRVSVRTEGFVGMEDIRRSSNKYDRVFSLNEVDYSSLLYLGCQIALDAGVDYDVRLAREAVNKQLQASNPKRDKICVVHAESIRDNWEGKNPNPSVLAPSIKLLQDRGYRVVLIGGLSPTSEYEALAKLCDEDLVGKTSLEETFTLVRDASLFLGIDSGPLHVAQLFGIPSFAIFGATLPYSKLLNLENSQGYVREDLDCIGCYHHMRNSPTNYCIRRDQACVKAIDGVVVSNKLRDFLDGKRSLDLASLAAERSALAAKQLSWTKNNVVKANDFSRARFRQLVEALWRKIYRIVVDKFSAIIKLGN